MIGLTGAVRVMVATRPVDFRKGAEGLAALVRETGTPTTHQMSRAPNRARRAIASRLTPLFLPKSACALLLAFVRSLAGLQPPAGSKRRTGGLSLLVPEMI